MRTTEDELYEVFTKAALAAFVPSCPDEASMEHSVRAGLRAVARRLRGESQPVAEEALS